MSKPKNQQASSISLDTLPEFMKSSPTPNVPFNSAFPPLSTKVRVRGVMERAGFDVYKPQPGSNRQSRRNFTSPTPSQKGKMPLPPNNNFGSHRSASGSSPSFGNNKRSFTTTQPSTHSFPNLLLKDTYNDKSPENFNPNIPKSKVNSISSSGTADTLSIHQYVDSTLASKPPTINRNNKPSLKDSLAVSDVVLEASEADTPTGLKIPPRFDLEQQPASHPEIPTLYEPVEEIDEMKPDSALEDQWSPEPCDTVIPLQPIDSDSNILKVRPASTSRQSYNSLDSFDRKFEAEIEEDPVEQLNGMKSVLESQEISQNDILNRNSAQSVGVEGKRLSTLATDDLNIYNLNGFSNEMSMIQERSFEDNDAAVVPDIELMNNSDDMALDKPVFNTTPDVESLSQSGFTKHTANAINSPNLKAESKPNVETNDQQLEAVSDAIDKLQLSTQEEKYPPGKGPCRKCCEQIFEHEKKIWSKDHQLSGQWHRKCFGCYECGSKFSKGSSCYVFGDAPYCERHFHRLNGSLCSACGRGVEGECMQNDLDEVFHFDCLRCGECHEAVDSGDYFTFQNQILCERDAQIMISKMNSPSVEDKVMKRRTRIMYL